MMTTDEGLYGELFVDREMAWVLGDEMLLLGMLSFESELAHALEAERIAPPGTAMAVAAHCDFRLYDIAEIGRAATLAGNPAIPLVKALTGKVAEASPEHAKWVHYGATSQDVIDSGQAYCIGRGLEIVDWRLSIARPR